VTHATEIEILMTTTTQVTVFENNELRIAGETAEIKLLKFASVPGIICDWS